MDMQRVSFGRSLITDAEDAASIDFGRSSASVYALTDLRTPNLPPEYYASATGLHSSAQECSWIRSPSPLVLRGKQQKLSVLPELEPRMDSEAFSDYDSDSVSSAQEDHTPTLATLTEMPRNLFTHTASFVHTSERASAPGEARLAMDAMLNIWPKLCACRPGLAFDMNESLLYITSRRFLSSPEAGELSLELQGHRASQFLDILLCTVNFSDRTARI
ncbi:hypothetical protein OE88DRAFT_904881 [Heliocybe sulcata]|uniref:Uncharacterized protein n=1 Tax=Heliocybe sulcata TaxID=5364 RepID=A0A5C3MMC8_9AGAM|nr:hypothetical protein OE88DRAFT_904881 [Heliocybe sulcata]